MRAWLLFALSAALGCGGKEVVGGTPVGSCALGAGNPPGVNQWECTGALVDAAGLGPLQQCPANVGAGISCVLPSAMGSIGFRNVIDSNTYAPCLQCASNGLGVVWTCSSQTQWEAGDVFSCGQ
jgi:hypothetical protein